MFSCNSWIYKIMLRSQVMPSFAYCTGYAIAAFSEEWVETLVHGVLLLY